MPKSLQGDQPEMDEVSDVICFPLCAREEDPLPPLYNLHPAWTLRMHFSVSA
jgi:hypothetical protein